MDTPVRRLNDEMLQLAINKECQRIGAKTHTPISAKTVRNEWGLIAAALKKVCKMHFEVTLPKKTRSLKRYPEPREVLRAIMDCPEKLPCLLAIWQTFTISEILGLKCSSIKDGYIYINQVRVFTDHGWIEKKIAKNARRNRVLKVPERLMTMIAETDAYRRYVQTGKDDFLFPGSRSKIYNAWTRTAKKHGLELSFHDLRHMSASIALMLGVPDLYEEERGGWSSNYIMKTTYDHVFSSGRIQADRQIDEFIENSLNELNERDAANPAASTDLRI
jgi:integrase